MNKKLVGGWVVALGLSLCSVYGQDGKIESDRFRESLQHQGPVNDWAEVFTPEQKAELTSRIEAAFRTNGSALVVVTLKSLQGGEIQDFAVKLFEQWGIGEKGKDNGVLLLVSTGDRKVRIEVGYGLEGAIPDATANRIIDEFILPHLRADDFAGGIAAGVDRLIGLVDGEALPEPVQSPGPADSFGNLLPVVLFVSIVSGAILRRVLGQLPGAAVTGLLITGLTWLMAGAIGMALIMGLVGFILSLAPAGRAGRWASHSRGGRGGGSFGGRGGGFSGGGGGFGGGGSSGRW